MKTSDFAVITKRLLVVLGLETETQLAERLGFTQTAWAKRKMRGAVPVDQIDALIAQEDLNPEFIYNGTGNVHAPVEGQTWQAQYTDRAKFIEVEKGWLKPQGHTDALVAGLMNPSGKILQVLVALRDLHDNSGVDLNWLLCAKPAVPDEEPLPPEAQALLTIFQALNKHGRSALLQTATALAQKKS